MGEALNYAPFYIADDVMTKEVTFKREVKNGKVGHIIVTSSSTSSSRGRRSSSFLFIVALVRGGGASPSLLITTSIVVLALISNGRRRSFSSVMPFEPLDAIASFSLLFLLRLAGKSGRKAIVKLLVNKKLTF